MRSLLRLFIGALMVWAWCVAPACAASIGSVRIHQDPASSSIHIEVDVLLAPADQKVTVTVEPIRSLEGKHVLLEQTLARTVEIRGGVRMRTVHLTYTHPDFAHPQQGRTYSFLCTVRSQDGQESHQVSMWPGPGPGAVRRLGQPTVATVEREALRHHPPLTENQVTVFFATNRNVAHAPGVKPRDFGARCGPITYGWTDIAIPVDHVRGQLEQPLFASARYDPRHYFQVDSVTTVPEATFLRQTIGKGDKNDVLVYVHGFNMSMEDALVRTAQLSYDAGFTGTPVAFCWPSQGELLSYAYDTGTAHQSVDTLALFLRRLVAERKALGLHNRIHLLGHSLGSRLLLRSLRQAVAGLPPGDVPFGHVIFAAGDVDRAEAASSIAVIRPYCLDVTSYFNRNDFALRVSEHLPGHKDRLGQELLALASVANVDASRVNTEFLAHGYFASGREVLIDLDLLLNHNVPPDNRPTIQEKVAELARHLTLRYWRFP